MEEWTAYNPIDIGFQRAGSGELHGRSPEMSTSYQSHSRARCKYMKVMQKPRWSKCFYGFLRLQKGLTPQFYQKKLLY